MIKKSETIFNSSVDRWGYSEEELFIKETRFIPCRTGKITLVFYSESKSDAHGHAWVPSKISSYYLENTAWISARLKNEPLDSLISDHSVESHELAHILLNQDHVDQDNLLGIPSRTNNSLTKEQCERILRSKFVDSDSE
ncbi:MAG: hypothetical protein KA715_12190 [Xanthomonadaceae bacterium]|nr:hypothetical protein [Xanthomonadaceae bacterium]